MLWTLICWSKELWGLNTHPHTGHKPHHTKDHSIVLKRLAGEGDLLLQQVQFLENKNPDIPKLTINFVLVHCLKENHLVSVSLLQITGHKLDQRFGYPWPEYLSPWAIVLASIPGTVGKVAKWQIILGVGYSLRKPSHNLGTGSRDTVWV